MEKKQKHSHSQYFLSLINCSQISVSSDGYLNSVYPLEYLKYPSPLYHKALFHIHVRTDLHMTLSKGTETTRHCTCTCHLSHSMISITSMTGTVMTLHVTCMLTCVTCRQSPQSVWHVTCKLLTWQADLDVWYSRVILTGASTSHDVTAGDEAAWHVTLWRRTRDWPPRSWAAGRWPPDTYAMFDVIVLNSEMGLLFVATVIA